ncbi:SGNH family hydrolase [Parafrankia soli]|uniref:SGNH/GDSL hydrolase family protein n=1 Tax=Parafrankia soli TaxID=2599596 RepID=UPI000AAA0BB9|nr:SGNH family hydrolase [Parafrankia soli]
MTPEARSPSAPTAPAAPPTAPPPSPRAKPPTPAEPAKPTEPATPAVSARRALLFVVACLALLAVLRSAAMVHAGEGMPPGTTRDLVLGVARPLDEVTSALRLNQPDRLLTKAFGHPDPTVGKADDSELAAAAALAEPDANTGTGTGTGQVKDRSRDGDAADALRTPTPADPLRVLVTGDSLTESLGPTITKTAPPAIRAETDTRFGTGLVRPDFFDWATHARHQVAERDPEAVVVAMGGNDGQGITQPDGTILPAGSPQWEAEYRRRAIVLMRIWSDGGTRRVYWLGLPPARSTTLNGYFARMNEATRAAADRVPGARFLDLRPTLSDGGAYTDYLTDGGGHSVLIRTRDGVHLTLDGARLAAGPVLHTLSGDWHLS